LATNKLMS